MHRNNLQNWICRNSTPTPTGEVVAPQHGGCSHQGFEAACTHNVKHFNFPLVPRVSIITPSFRGNDWLPLCIASVADQGLSLQHIVQDAGSDDGTLDWLCQDPRVSAFVERDGGMYDAINRGLRRAQGDILCWLNSDEQYLPGALQQASNFFDSNPEIDVLFGDVVIIGAGGHYLWHRKMQVPLKYHTWTCHLSTLSCAMFFRRRVIFERGFWFDTSWRAGGDGEWMVRLLKADVGMAVIRTFTSAFTQTGMNMGAGANAQRENVRLRNTAPGWARAAKPLLVMHHRLRRWLGGMYSQAPFHYEVYTRKNPERRNRFEVRHPRFRPETSLC